MIQQPRTDLEVGIQSLSPHHAILASLHKQGIFHFGRCQRSLAGQKKQTRSLGTLLAPLMLTSITFGIIGIECLIFARIDSEVAQLNVGARVHPLLYRHYESSSTRRDREQSNSTRYGSSRTCGSSRLGQNPTAMPSLISASPDARFRSNSE